jgi:hypothetical protein
MVTMLTTYDFGLVSLAKSILDGAGIGYLAKNEGLQATAGQGPALGPMEICVSEADAETARELLRELTP